MLFNSGTFLQFFAAFVLLYYIVRNHLGARNLLIVFASYLFYGWWDYRFLALLIFSSLLDYSVGLALGRIQEERQRRLLLIASIACNLLILGVFKYYDFFVNSMAAVLSRFGLSPSLPMLHVVLPVGISFYTFQTMSYAIDVYRRDMQPTRNLIHFMAYVSFFPQLVAGPIERGTHLLPQFSQTRHITLPMLEEGFWLCLWGLFKKVVLADNLAPLVEMVYDHEHPSGPFVVLATIAFGLQIYCDFSGYSDVARGTARMLGFDIMWNFNLPYFATSLRDFWRRWHISLSTWLRDYLYLSMGGNRAGPFKTYRNLGLTMILGGLWHGAAWNFVAWGLWHGLGLVMERVVSQKSRSQDVHPLPQPASLQIVSSGGRWCLTMAFVFYGWLLFRAGSWHQIVTLTKALREWTFPAWSWNYIVVLTAYTLPLILVQLWQARARDLLIPIRLPRFCRTLLQGGLLIVLVLFWEKEKVPFIYFQF